MSNNTIKVRTFNPGAGAYGEDGPAYQGNLRKGELRGIIHINKEHCVGCDTCSKFCPVNAIEGGLGAKHHIIEDACLYCGQCLIACPFDAIEQMSFVDQVEKVLADKSRLCVAHPSPAVRVSICEDSAASPANSLRNSFPTPSKPSASRSTTATARLTRRSLKKVRNSSRRPATGSSANAAKK